MLHYGKLLASLDFDFSYSCAHRGPDNAILLGFGGRTKSSLSFAELGLHLHHFQFGNASVVLDFHKTVVSILCLVYSCLCACKHCFDMLRVQLRQNVSFPDFLSGFDFD